MQEIKLNDKTSIQLVAGALQREIEIIKSSIKLTEKKLSEFETKNKISSKQFLKKYEAGEAGDDMEVMIWASEIKILKKLTEDYRKLTEVKLVS